MITKRKIHAGYIEAKDIGKDLDSSSYKGQFDRYKDALDNLIITDYLTFRYFVGGKLVREVRIGEIDDKRIKPLTENYEEFANLIKNFCPFIGQTIKSPKKLAMMMAGKARLLKSIFESTLTSEGS